MKTKTKTLPSRIGENENSTACTIRTFLADDDPFMLALLSKLLASDPRITIVGSATDGRKAFHSAAMSSPDLVITDLHMPIADGVEVTRWLKQLRNAPTVFVVTSDDSPDALNRSLAAGADAFLVKAADLDVQLQLAIQDCFPAQLEEQKKHQDRVYELITTTE
jgi:DNA-binding NarL/FixJ family response regulator